MDDVKTRVVNAAREILNKYFECPERNWSAATHAAIAKVKAELVERLEAEFDRKAPAAAVREAK